MRIASGVMKRKSQKEGKGPSGAQDPWKNVKGGKPNFEERCRNSPKQWTSQFFRHTFDLMKWEPMNVGERKQGGGLTERAGAIRSAFARSIQEDQAFKSWKFRKERYSMPIRWKHPRGKGKH